MGTLGGLVDMRLNQFVFLIASTVVLGAIVGIGTALIGFGVHLPWFVALIEGAFLATTSLMGFWAYLTLNFIARTTLPQRFWRWAQILIVALVLYDMLWSRYHLDVARNPLHHTAFSIYLIQGLWPLVVAAIGAAVKLRLSGKGSFLPTLFYLYVFTIIDWLLVLKAHSNSMVNQTGLVMMVCNVYMILIFGFLLSPKEERDFVPEKLNPNVAVQRKKHKKDAAKIAAPARKKA